MMHAGMDSDTLYRTCAADGGDSMHKPHSTQAGDQKNKAVAVQAVSRHEFTCFSMLAE
jgi:hypothetical protein